MNLRENIENRMFLLKGEDKPGFDRRMTREEINKFPIKSYEGPVSLIKTRDELIPAIESLKSETVLGFDTETKPSFTKGKVYLPAIIQIAGKDAVYIFKLNNLNFPGLLNEILSNKNIIKTGVGIDNDIAKLKEIGSFNQSGFIDLGEIAKKAGIKNHGLRGLAAVFLGFRISKRAQVSNWARKNLSQDQIKYAATDAWVSRQLYLRMAEELLNDG
jgi:ribonuclease D